MRFSFVLARGRLATDALDVLADGRTYHFDLPRDVNLFDRVEGSVEGEPISVTAIDLLGALRSLHGGGDGWLGAGSRAQLVGAGRHRYAEGQVLVDRIRSIVENGALLDDAGRVEELDAHARRRNLWKAFSPSERAKNGEIAKSFENREDAKRWLQRRALVRGLGWPAPDLDELLDTTTIAPTLDEILDLCNFFDETPSRALRSLPAELK